MKAAPVPREIKQAFPGRPRHLAGLTGLRGIAAWWVVLFHFREFLPGALPAWFIDLCGFGYSAVDLFFILSGFIIAYNYLVDFQTIALRPSLHFLGVRLARVYPLHFFMLVVFLLNPLAIGIGASQAIDTARYDPGYYVLSVFLLQNWGFTHSTSWNVPAWSISTEWFAYLCFPLIARVANHVPRGLGPAVAGILLPLAILAAGLCLAGETLGGDISQFGLFRCVTEFTAGIFLYRLWLQFGHLNRVRVVAGLIAAGCLVVYSSSSLADFWLVPVAWASLIISLTAGQQIFTATFSSRILELIGLRSYSTYLVHYFVRDWVKFLLVHQGTNLWVPLTCYLAGTAVASALLYRAVEVPGRRFVRRQVDRFTRSSPLVQ